MEYSTARLLQMALTMLETAQAEQVRSNRKDKWLVDNATMAAIRARVDAIKDLDDSDPVADLKKLGY